MACSFAKHYRPSLPQPTPHTRRLQPPASPAFLPLPETALQPLEELLRAKVVNLLVEEMLLPPERERVIYSWKHSGFNQHPRSAISYNASEKKEDFVKCFDMLSD